MSLYRFNTSVGPMALVLWMLFCYHQTMALVESSPADTLQEQTAANKLSPTELSKDSLAERQSITRFKIGTGMPELLNLGMGVRLHHRHELHLNLSFVAIPGTETTYILAVPSLEHRLLFGPQMTNQRRFYWKNALGALVPTHGYYAWGTALGINLGRHPKHSVSIDAGISGVFTNQEIFPSIRLQKNFHYRRR